MAAKAAQVKAAQVNAADATPVSGFLALNRAAFNAALVQVEVAAQILADHKAAKPDAKVMASASRLAAWAAFDLVQAALALPKDDATPVSVFGGELAVQIATARGLEGATLDTYRARGRGLVTFAAEIAKEGATYTLAKGKHKGEVRNGRDERDPLTLAKKFMATASDNAKRKAEAAEASGKYGAAALAQVAATLTAEGEPMTAEDVATQIATADAETAQALRNMVAEAMAAQMERASRMTDFRAMLDRLKDGPTDADREYFIRETLATFGKTGQIYTV